MDIGETRLYIFSINNQNHFNNITPIYTYKAFYFLTYTFLERLTA